MKNKAQTAQDEVTQLDEAERKLREHLAVLEGELAVAASERGANLLDAVVAGEEPGTGDSRLAEIRGNIADIMTALEELDRRRGPAVRQAKAERAEMERARASELFAEAEKHGQETDRLLALLEAHEGVKYGTFPGLPGIPHTQQLRRQGEAAKGRAMKLEIELIREGE